MFSMTGTVQNTFSNPGNEKYPEPSYKAQILGEHVTKDGQTRLELVSLTVPFEHYQVLSGHLGKRVRIPVGMFADKGGVRLYFPKGHSEKIVED